MSPYKEKPHTKKITVDGVPYYVHAKTEEEAIAKAAIRKQEILEGRKAEGGERTVNDWCAEWLETYKLPAVNAKHYRDIEHVVEKFIVPAIGKKKLRTVKQADLQKIMNGLSIYSDSYIKKIYDVIRQAFGTARDNGMILNDPSAGIRKPKGQQKKTRRAITDRERELILNVAETNRGGLFVLIMLYCGLRPGEVAALHWSDIDMTRAVLHVRQAVKSAGDVGEPKTASGVRDVPIPPPLMDRLQKEKHGPFDLVVKNTKGGRFTASSIQRMWKTYKREMQLAAGCRTYRNQLIPPYPVAEDLTLYCLRHTYGTDLQAAGVPINVAKELMGHSSIAVTANIYTHGSEKSFMETAEKIAKYHA